MSRRHSREDGYQALADLFEQSARSCAGEAEGFALAAEDWERAGEIKKAQLMRYCYRSLIVQMLEEQANAAACRDPVVHLPRTEL